MIDLAELDRLHAAATSGTWRVDGTKALGAYGVWQADNLGTPDAVMVCRAGHEINIGTITERNANMALIAALHNAWHGISMELRQLRQSNAQLTEACLAVLEELDTDSFALRCEPVIRAAIADAERREGI